MTINGGIAIKPTPAINLACDMQNALAQNGQPATMHYGAEAVILPGLLARAGLSDGSKTLGMSLAVRNLIVDYAYLGGSYLRTQMLGLTWRF